jgi:hypothetical protein
LERLERGKKVRVPRIRLPELNKQEGVCYAVTDDGLELPVVDVTHPAFQVKLSDDRQRALVARFLNQQRRFAKLPKLVRGLMLRVFMRGSIMSRGLRRAEGTFLDGMTTYLFKVGAKNLGEYAMPADRRVAASLPGLAVRMRLADMAELLADALVPRLAGAPGRALHFLNIAGGPGIDSLNALILLAERNRRLLSGRKIRVCVLDGDQHGPAFGARALQALQQAGAPLAGIEVEFRHVAYDWREPQGLTAVLAAAREAGALVIGSSEGGLFEYGSDDAILGNLIALAKGLGSSLCVVGSVTRNDDPIRTLKLTSTAATRPRGLEVFSALVARADWRVVRSISRPLSDQVVIEPLAAGS